MNLMCRAPHAFRIYAAHLNTHNARLELIKVRLIIFAKLNFNHIFVRIYMAH